ncbi:MAG: hypothetical protein IKC94_01345 [Lentisphaeria bacterium]|nr:hypothetical protein [Lentisphaeria bacterium]
MDITGIDKNFSAQTADENGFIFCNVKEPPFSLEGLPWYQENGQCYYRLPKNMTVKDVNEGALSLSYHTSGVCVRFRSDSSQIMIRAKLSNSCDMNHMPRAGSAGFDTFCKMPGGKLLYNCTVKPSPGQVDISEVAGNNPDRKFAEWIINFPLYGGVDSVEIGLKADCRLAPPKAHKVPHPVLFYGSSITQGGCASRPGNAYSSMLCRAVDAEQINLGFSGSAKGETAVAEAIASLELSALVLDYDHNAPDKEHLLATHEPFFKIIRKKQPDLPVLMLSKCDFAYIDQASIDIHSERREIIRQTYQNAVNAGDKHVYFIDGEKLFGTDLRDCCTVDGCHPNDLGFYRMYKCVLPVLKKALK